MPSSPRSARRIKGKVAIVGVDEDNVFQTVRDFVVSESVSSSPHPTSFDKKESLYDQIAQDEKIRQQQHQQKQLQQVTDHHREKKPSFSEPDTDSSKESANVNNINFNRRPSDSVSSSSTSSHNHHTTSSLFHQLSNTSSCSQQPPSINLYESYFDDSYVGDFTGDVDDTLLEQQFQNLSDVQSRWCTDPDLNPSLLEFTYDSFGPESIVFAPGPLENTAATTLSDNSLSQFHSPQPTLSHQSEKDCNPLEPRQPRPYVSTLSQDPSVEDQESLLMSLSISEPQLRDKLNKCFDNRRISNGYGIALVPEVDEKEDEENPPFIEKNLTSASPNEHSPPSSLASTKEAKQEKPLDLPSSITTNMTAHDDLDTNNSLGGGSRPEDKKVPQPQNRLATPLNNTIALEVGKLQEVTTGESDEAIKTEPKSEVIPVDVICSDDSMSREGICSPEGSSMMSTTSPSLSSCASPDSFSSDDKSTLGFSRNSTLTKSQRKKISPRINFEQILNASDESKDAGLLLLPSKLSPSDVKLIYDDGEAPPNGHSSEKDLSDGNDMRSPSATAFSRNEG